MTIWGDVEVVLDEVESRIEITCISEGRWCGELALLVMHVPGTDRAQHHSFTVVDCDGPSDVASQLLEQFRLYRDAAGATMPVLRDPA